MRSLHALRLVEMTSGGGPEGPHGVEHGEYGHTYVGKHGKPHRCDAKGCEDKNSYLDTDGASMAASLPSPPMAIPTSARASTGASLMPSPTKARCDFSD